MRSSLIEKLVGGGALALAVTLASCISQQATPPSDDAGVFVQPDSGAPPEDAGPPDAGPPDVGAPPVDSGPGDAGPSDSGPGDAGPSCGSNNGECPAHSTCVIDAGIVCACDPGFAGATCASMCLTGNGGCDPNATCGNGDAGVACTCNAGFNGTGLVCASDCLTGNGGCDPNATCSLDVAGVVCACNPGFTGNGTSCASNDYTEWPAPPDAPLESEYTVSADGTIVTDAVTGLRWQRQLLASPCPGDVDAGAPGGCTWADSQTYCASLNALGGVGLGSVTGWRVPSAVELISIVNYDDGAPALDTALFPATPAVPFWTHTTDAADATQAWAVTFAAGTDAPQAVTTTSQVRCVTSHVPPSSTPACGTSSLACCYASSCGVDLACTSSICSVDSSYAQSVLPADSPPEPGYAVSPGGSVVTDSVTGLVWQRQILANPCPSDADAGATVGGCTWTDATTYCSSLNGVSLGGYSAGWRLPSAPELLSIASYTATPAIDPSPFSNPPAAVFWSATPNAFTAGQAWAVSYVNGTDVAQSASTTLDVRCVNSGGVSPSPEGCGAVGGACCYASTCAAPLLCSSGTCITDTNYALGPVAPDAPSTGADGGASEYTVAGSVLTDTVTGLVWAINPGGSTPCPGDGTGAACTWAHASALCAGLDSAGTGGLTSGWRQPSVIELLSIVNYALASGPKIDGVFTGVTAAPYWTSTLGAGTTGQAWSVNFSNGTDALATTSSALGPMCVN